MSARVFERIDSMRNYAVKLLMDIISRPAVNPSFGGEGELDKANFLLEVLREYGFDKVEVVNAPDPRAKGGVRPNILAYIKGEVNDKLWVLTHLDVVPPGDLSAWTKSKPFEPVYGDGRVYGRGAEDNGQSMVASIIAAKALLEEGARPRRTVVLSLVADEEAGSEYGLSYLIKSRPELFSKGDVALVPDAGVSDGSFIEVAEKSILWVKLRVKGAQVHASIPHKGLNAHRIAAELLRAIDELVRSKYGARDELFDPPYTTCEPTMVRNSSGSPNIIPGEHEVVIDCRVLPGAGLDELLEDFGKAFEQVRKEHGKTIEGKELPQLEFEILNRADAAPPTSPDSPIVKGLVKALEELRGVKARVGGIGGGTVAAFFRRIGIPAAVWSTIDETAHMPNEYCKVDNLVGDAKVFAYLMLNA